MSNSKNHSIENSLTHFQNEFLDTTYLQSHKNWEISLDQIGLHARFKNYGPSKNNKLPALLTCTRLYFTYILNCNLFDSSIINCKLKLTDFDVAHKYFLDEKEPYTPWLLHHVFVVRTKTMLKKSNGNSKYHGMVTEIDIVNNKLLFGQFNPPLSDMEMTMRQQCTTLFFHMNFKTALEFDDSLFDGTILIDNEQYFWIYNKKKKHPLELSLSSTGLFLQIPKIIKVVCPNVKPFITQDGYSREIGLIPINEEDNGKYINRKILSKEVFSLEDDRVKSLEIQFRDQNDNVLRLSDGLPSMVKLHAKEATMDQFCIHVS